MMELLYPLALLSLVSIPLWLWLFPTKPHSPKISVSSLLIWNQISSSPLKPRQRQWLSPLSLLPLLCLFFLSLASTLPYQTKPTPQPLSLSVIIDRTASMQAPQGKSNRWTKGIQTLLSLLSKLPPSKITLYTYPDLKIWENLTKEEAKAILSNLSPSWQTGDLKKFLANWPKTQDLTLVLTDEPLSSSSAYYTLSVGSPLPNWGILQVGCDWWEKRPLYLLRIGNFSPTPKKLSLHFLSKEIPLSLAPFQTKDLLLNLPQKALLHLQLKPLDLFPWDNHLYLHSRSHLPVFYAFSTPSALWYALRAYPGTLSVPTPKEALLSVDKIPHPLPLSFILPSPFSSSAPFRKVFSTDVFHTRFPFLSPIQTQAKILAQKLPGTPLLLSEDHQPVLTQNLQKNREQYYFAFFPTPSHTPWVKSPSFAYFIFTLLDKLSATSYGFAKVGQPLWIPQNTTTILSPSHKKLPPSFPFSPQEIGVYYLRSPFSSTPLAVNLLSKKESDLYTSPTPLQWPKLSSPSTPTKHFFHPWLVWLTFLLLLTYWHFRQ